MIIFKIINYRFTIAVIALTAALGRAHEVFVEEAFGNPAGTMAKIIGIIIIVWFLLDDDLLQSKDR